MNYKTKYWQDIKLSKPNLNNYLYSVAIGMIISDAYVKKHGKYAYIKFEQGVAQKEFLSHLFDLFKDYTFATNYSIRYINKTDKIKSYYFKTFTHPTFIHLYDLFYKNNIKGLNKNFILDYVNEISLAYWIMGDGSLNKRDKILTLHTENYSEESNIIIKNELNKKFNLECTVGVSYKNNKQYYMIYIPKRNLSIIQSLTDKYIIDSMKYKINK